MQYNLTFCMKICGIAVVKEWLGPDGYVETVVKPKNPTNRPLIDPPKIIFPYDPVSKTFDTSLYNEALTNNKIKTSDIKQFLAGIENILTTNFTYLKPIKLIDWVVMTLIFLMIAGALCAIIGLGGIIARIIAITFAVVLFFTLKKLALDIIAKKTLINITKQVVDYITQIHNQETFVSQGYQWRIQENFPLWIELWRIGPTVDQGRLVYGELMMPLQYRENESGMSSPLIKNPYLPSGAQSTSYV